MPVYTKLMFKEQIIIYANTEGKRSVFVSFSKSRECEGESISKQSVFIYLSNLETIHLPSQPESNPGEGQTP